MHKSGSHTPRGNFTSKRGNKNWYKGKGGKKYGTADHYGRFVLRGRGRPNWFMPDLGGFNVRAAPAARAAPDLQPDALRLASQLKPYVLSEPRLR